MKPFDENSLDGIFREKLGNFSEMPPDQVLAKLKNSWAGTPPPQPGWLMRNWILLTFVGVTSVVAVTLAFNTNHSGVSMLAGSPEKSFSSLNAIPESNLLAENSTDEIKYVAVVQSEAGFSEISNEAVSENYFVSSELAEKAQPETTNKSENGTVVNIDKKLPDIQINIQVTNATCRKPNGEIKLSSANGQRYSYFWDDASGNVSLATRSNLLPHKYNVRVVNETGGDKLYEIVVGDAGTVKAEFTHYEVSKAAGLPIYFENKSKYENSLWNENSGVTFKWYFGDNTSSINPEPDHIYNQAGSFNISLVAYSSLGCKDSVAINDFTVSGTEVEMPNTFSPNNDGINDYFIPDVTGMVVYKCTIFIRSGEAVYEWVNDGRWDGKLKGGKESAAPGVYYYVLDGKGSDGKNILRKGFVQLFL